ncbi:hypothetical protein GCM10023172_29960 [Hymenobacter ginsengisoli]|uniref:Uncharacterized protein n=1 Tax=Hymenobacter ginsengisoli TaxID=1051626 RepID=A0ABP8QIP1_9BACT|nr:hypothetical protein [Hymenobacter sp. BT559]MBO2033480.1 hypothetical protein [Hymenobacter sp. BT559]
MRLPPTSLLLAALLGLSQCKKNDSSPAKPEDQLPPATQTGQHTFGCLLNGQPWTPAGNPFGGPLFTAEHSRGNFYLTANRAIMANGVESTQRIQVEVDSITTYGCC